MKNKKTILIILAVIIIIAVVVLAFVLTKNKNNNNNNDNSVGEVSPNNPVTVESPANELPDETTEVTLYVGEGENYTQVSAKYNANADKQEQIKRLVEKIGISIGYKIEVNKVEITDNEIHIDFKSTGAPFNDSAYFGNEAEGLFVEDYKTLVYRIFDSIKQTLQSVYGESTQIYYTVDEKSMSFNNITPRLAIGADIPYVGLS